MEEMIPRCAGLDVHEATVVASARVVEGQQVREESATFETTTKGLLRLFDWLTDHGCTHVAMEATGVYWKPVWHILEGHFELVLANPGHIKNVPGRKTDVSDAQWIARLLAHGLIRSSFVPPRPVQEMRDLTRTRKQLVREEVQHTQRILKLLQDANLKLTEVISDIRGLTGQEVLHALVNGVTDPEELADLCGRLRKAKRSEIVEALRGNVTPHHRFLLKIHLAQIAALEGAEAQIEQQLGQVLEPFRLAAERLTAIPGISNVAASAIIAEIGIDMTRFPTDGHLVSWAGLCPRCDESAGKRRSTRTRDGSPWLKSLLVQCAWCARKKKDSYFRAQFLRIQARRGPKKAAVAVAASILTTVYHMLLRNVAYQDLGADYFMRRDRNKVVKRLVRRLEDLGCKVTIDSAA
jgi:transposase